jgi:hypothetical protein
MKGKLVIAVALALFFVTGASAEIYLWPMHGERRLSSSFGEYREGHYHAGIDLRTFGRRGLPCLAVTDGAVSRVKIAPAGYGKALYLKLDDGRTAVYAHCHSFARSIDSLAYFHRLGKGTSWCDLTLSGDRFRYSVGDTVAFTGITGTTAPHLHFELRDERSRPFNPLESIYGLPDNSPPIISGLAVLPVTAGSVAAGSALPVISLLRASGGRLYMLPDTLHLDGDFGFAVAAWDEQGAGRYRMAPFSIELNIDGRLLYRVTNSSFSYAQTREILLEYDLLEEGPTGRYLVLFRREGSTRRDREGPGIVTQGESGVEGLILDKGLHRGEIICRDVSGNESRAYFHFAMHGYPAVEIAKKLEAANEVVVSSSDPEGGPVRQTLYESTDGGTTWDEVGLEPLGSYWRGAVTPSTEGIYRLDVTDPEGAVTRRYFAGPRKRAETDMVFCECIPESAGETLILHIASDRILAGLPSVVGLGAGAAETASVHLESPRSCVAFFDARQLDSGETTFLITGRDHRGYPLRSYKALQLFVQDSGSESVLVLSDTLRVILASPSVRGKGICIIHETTSPGPLPAGLRAVSEPFFIDFSPAQFIRPLELVCSTDKRTGLFRFDPEKGWRCVGVPWVESGRIKVNRTGFYAFFSDGIPPDIKHAAIEQTPRGSGFFKSYIISMPVVESGSGVDPYSAQAFLNDTPVVCEWDDFRERLYIPVTASTPAGSVILRVELSDRSGNRSAGEFGFVLE